MHPTTQQYPAVAVWAVAAEARRCAEPREEALRNRTSCLSEREVQRSQGVSRGMPQKSETESVLPADREPDPRKLRLPPFWKKAIVEWEVLP